MNSESSKPTNVGSNDQLGLVERLRKHTQFFRPMNQHSWYASSKPDPDCQAAADEIERLRAALEVYADPRFYHACSFAFDRPTGGFDEDFDYSDEYERDMPGKLAREALGPNVGAKPGATVLRCDSA